MFAALLDLLAPPACVVCRAGGATPLCGDCRRALRHLRWQDVCPRCGLPRPCDRTGGRCPATGAPWRTAWAPVAYAGPATGMVAALKFRGALPCARVMAAHMVQGLPPGLAGPAATLVPVPTHPARARRRGFDQAVVLARAVGARTGLPVQLCLRRAGAPVRQLGAGREERLREDRIVLHCRVAPRGPVLLVDDVHTTGATLRAAGRALRVAGAEDVAALTWARAL